MPLPNRRYPALACFHLPSRLSFGVLPLQSTRRRQLSNRTPHHTSSRAQAAGARRNFSVAAFPTSSPDGQLTAKCPFTILFCGRDSFSCTVFKEVYNAKDVWKDLHIVTNPDVRAGRRGSRLDISPLKMVGESLGVPVHTIPENKVAFKKWLPPPPFTPHPNSSGFQNASHLLVTASFGRILPATFLRLFPDTHRLNVHPSMLPAYRGPAPIQRALIAGERETGVCVIEMGEVSRREGKLVDAGRIWAFEKMDIPEDVNFLHMQEVLAVSGGKLLVNVLRDMLVGRAQSRSQEAMTSTMAHAPLIAAGDSTIDFASQTALVIARLERAIGHQRSLMVPGALPDGRGVAIAGLQVTPAKDVPVTSFQSCPGTAYYSPETRSLVVRCAKGTWLSVQRLQTQNRAMLEAREWWNGVKGLGWVEEGKLFRFVAML